METMPHDKYDAFKEFYNDRDTLLDSTDFLIPVFKTLTDGLFNEIDSNKYKFQQQGRFNEYKSERLEFMFKSLSEIVEGLRPTIKDIPYDLNLNKVKKDGTRYKPRIKTFQTMGYPLRLQFLRPNKSEADAAKQIQDEVDFIDSLIKKIEMKKSEIKDLLPEAVKEEINNSPKDKLTHKQQILLLKTIGFFDLPIFQTLSTKNKGILVSSLLNRTEKDSKDFITYLLGKNKKERFEVRTDNNIKAVKELLIKIGKTDIEVS